MLCCVVYALYYSGGAPEAPQQHEVPNRPTLRTRRVCRQSRGPPPEQGLPLLQPRVRVTVVWLSCSRCSCTGNNNNSCRTPPPLLLPVDVAGARRCVRRRATVANPPTCLLACRWLQLPRLPTRRPRPWMPHPAALVPPPATTGASPTPDAVAGASLPTSVEESG